MSTIITSVSFTGGRFAIYGGGMVEVDRDGGDTILLDAPEIERFIAVYRALFSQEPRPSP